MRKCVLVLLYMCCTFPVFAEIQAEVKPLFEAVRSLNKDIKNVTLYEKVTKLSSLLPKSKTRDLYFSMGLLGAQFHGDSQALKFFDKSLKKDAFIEGISKVYHSRVNYVDCSICKTKKNYVRRCAACKGKTSCPNEKCSGGQTESLDRVEGKFITVRKECSACSGTKNCNVCKGTGEAKKRCNKCNSAGKVFQRNRSFVLFKKLCSKLELELIQKFKAKE